MKLIDWSFRVVAITAVLYLVVLVVALPVSGSGRKPSAEEPLLSEVRQLIFQGRRSGEGYFSVDGQSMIFQSERIADNPFYQMYVMDLQTGDTRRVSTGVGKTTCGWIHPHGKKVLFASSHEDPKATEKQRKELDKRAAGKGSRYSWSFDEYYDIYQRDLEGGGLRNLTRTRGYDAEGSWSADGKLIVFASNRHAYSEALSAPEQEIFAYDKSYFMDIYIMKDDGTQVQRLTDTAGYDGGPFFSPDGRRIVWRRFSPDGAKAEVWTMNTDGSDKRQVTHLDVMSWAPYYHPSGEYIIFTNNSQGFANFELYIVDTEGTRAPVRVTHTAGFDGLPVFSPDGRRLAWASARGSDHRAQIFLAQWDHERARRLLGLTDSAESEPSPQRQEGSLEPDLSHTSESISADDLRLHVQYLASETMQGRLTGTQGERLATAYVASVFESLGLSPAGDDGSYFQTFEFTSGVSLDQGNRLELSHPQGEFNLSVDKDWRPLAISRSGVVEPSEIVFAGYGIVAPAGNGFAVYDAYEGLDVKDKWVMVFRYMPEDIAPERRLHLTNYFDLRYKAMIARDKGARGLILVNGPNADVKKPLIELTSDTGGATTSIAVLSITDDLAARILGYCGADLQRLQDRFDKGENEKGFVCDQTKLTAEIHLRKERREGRNVLARLAAQERDEDSVVIIGAHVDHIGHGHGQDSLATAEESGKVHFGADDNASGVGGLLEVAQFLRARQKEGKLKLKHDVIFAAWSGEELGTLGSNHFVKSRADNEGHLPKVFAYLNMDMIGRLDEKLYLQGTGSSSHWSAEIEQRNAPIGLSIATQDDSYLPTDATPFYLAQVPVLNAFTGAHEDYNTPRDTADKLNYSGTARIARLMALITRSLAMRDEPLDYIAMSKPSGSVSRRNLRAYLGTIPEYGENTRKGVKLNGVAAGGPAELGGLRRGDVIVELAGTKIETIYDYTYALNALKVGDPVEIVVYRKGRLLRFNVTPASRE